MPISAVAHRAEAVGRQSKQRMARLRSIARWREGKAPADPARGSISHVSPLARAMFGKRAGGVVRAGAGLSEGGSRDPRLPEAVSDGSRDVTQRRDRCGETANWSAGNGTSSTL